METINKITTAIPVIIIRCYQIFISPVLQSSCRHIPTCSEYALEAFREYGLLRGFYYTGKRLISCRPGGGHGYDPIPKPGTKTHE